MPDRRAVLRTLAAGVGPLAGGCTAPSDSSGADRRSPTSTPSPTFTATVRQQATADKAPQVGVRLANHQPDSLHVGFGPALLFTDTGATAELFWPDRLVLDPETYVGPWDEPTQDQTGCWRFPEVGSRPVQGILEWRELAPGDALTETYEVYTLGSSGPCLPAGTYRFQDRGYVGDESHALVLTLSIAINSTHQISVDDEGTRAAVQRVRRR